MQRTLRLGASGGQGRPGGRGTTFEPGIAVRTAVVAVCPCPPPRFDAEKE
jgi:hypothetical protein